jgi:hypothetical protein
MKLNPAKEKKIVVELKIGTALMIAEVGSNL